MNTIQRRTFIGTALAAPLLASLRWLSQPREYDEATFTLNGVHHFKVHGYADGQVDAFYNGHQLSPAMQKHQEYQCGWREFIGSADGYTVAMRAKYRADERDFLLDWANAWGAVC